jgi:hypothetical protein
MKTRKFDNPSKSTAKSQSRRRASRKFKAPRSPEEYFAKPARFQELWNRITHVIAKMRAGNISLSEAAREVGVDPRTVVSRSGSALRKSPKGRYGAKKSDRMLRVLMVPSQDGTREIAVRSSRQATELGKYWAALQKYLQTGDASALRKFSGKHIVDASGSKVPLITDLTELDRIASAGNFRFESIYSGGN